MIVSKKSSQHVLQYRNCHTLSCLALFTFFAQAIERIKELAVVITGKDAERSSCASARPASTPKLVGGERSSSGRWWWTPCSRSRGCPQDDRIGRSGTAVSTAACLEIYFATGRFSTAQYCTPCPDCPGCAWVCVFQVQKGSMDSFLVQGGGVLQEDVLSSGGV